VAVSKNYAPASVKVLLVIEHFRWGNEGYDLWVREYMFPRRTTRILEKRKFYQDAAGVEHQGRALGFNKKDWHNIMNKARDIEALLDATPGPPPHPKGEPME
jgi:predicted RNase H-like nuclease